MGLHDFTFYDLICRNSYTYGKKMAWLEADDGRSISFAGFKERVDRLAGGLQRQGLQKGDRIGIVGKNSLEYFMVFGAAAALGAIALPVNWRLSAEEVGFILRDGAPRIVLADLEFQELAKRPKDMLGSVEGFFSLGSESPDFPAFESLMDSQGDFNPVEVHADDGFVIIYTAAVAGRPRGAILSHGNVLCADMHFAKGMNLNHGDVHLHFLPLFHVGGLFMATTGYHMGALNLNLKKFEAATAGRLIQEKRVSYMMVFSPVLASLLEEQEKQGVALDSLRAVTGIDTPETIEKYQRLTGGTFYSLYGLTETSCLVSLSPYSEKPGSAGRALPLIEVRLVDDDGRRVPLGQVGEITVRGPMVFKGYWGLPEETAYTFRDGWHHTGDLGRFDEDGFLWYSGRKAEKELIKPGGENVYPAEVEKVILQHTAVQEVVVFGVPDPKWKEGIKAVCRLKPGFRLEPGELIDFVGERIARYKKPQVVEFVSDFPRHQDGSVDRAKTKARYGGTP
jgi:long-chain acyl-CoA synthetase